ncbi:putative transcription factor [Tripterygium wilfordii]|uniref:Putative transcription factor n=1 Tax=Tripterygium wilfordii TaxID=458696 RepID=A0A7J7CPF3_TRIWF|nr:NAC domain-containing protein 83-like [Tripterygium wilfordii]KAF5735849.1 putative transcription factor [Tripterygium wilfordii]
MQRSASSLVINGGLGVRLPVGYRFHPTDEELVVHYLRKKVFDLPLPASVIPDLDVFQTHPWSLPGDLKEKRYFFSKRERNNNDNGKKRKRVKTSDGSGYWKPNGKERKIVDPVSNEVVGLKKSLVFCQYSTAHFECSTNTETEWVMHEFRLFGNQISMKALMKETWVVHSLFQKKRKPKRHGHGVRSYVHDEVIDRPSLMDFMVETNDDHEGPPQPASPCFSEVTDEISSRGYLLAHEQEETSSTSTANDNISFCSSFSRMRNKN